jgi:hypothetical protein
MRAFGEAFTTRQAGAVRRSQDLMSATRGVLDHADVERVLALLKAGRIPYPYAMVAGVPLRASAARARRATL